MKLKYLATAALPFILVSSLTGCGNTKTKINVNDYVTTNLSGYDGYGYAFWQIDLEQFVKENREAFGLAENFSDTEYQWIVADLKETIKFDYNKSDKLSNGDAIQLVYDSSGIEELEKKYDVKLVAENIDVTVSGLEGLTELNLFDMVEPVYQETAPYTIVTYIDAVDISDRSFLKDLGIDFEYDTSCLSNGDVVTISVSEECYNSLLAEGFLLTEKEREYIVNGVDSYLLSLDELPADADKAMEQNGVELITSKIDNPATITMLGNYLLTPKRNADGWVSPYGGGYLIYVYEINGTDGSIQYACVKYSGIIILGDDTCTYSLQNATFYTDYADLDSLYNDMVASVSDDYNCQSTVS